MWMQSKLTFQFFDWRWFLMIFPPSKRYDLYKLSFYSWIYIPKLFAMILCQNFSLGNYLNYKYFNWNISLIKMLLARITLALDLLRTNVWIIVLLHVKLFKIYYTRINFLKSFKIIAILKIQYSILWIFLQRLLLI